MRYLSRRLLMVLAASLIVTLAVVACGSSTPATKPGAAIGDVAKGKTLYNSKGCVACHGPNAEGGVGPKTAGTALSFEDFKKQVRTPRDTMLPFTPAQVSDDELRDIYAYLKSQ